MREFYFNGAVKQQIVDLVSKHYRPASYWLHTKAGGAGWSVHIESLNVPDSNRVQSRTVLRVDEDFDESIITFILLSK